MKTPYFVFNDLHIARIPKSGSSAIARAIHYALHPDYIVRSASGNQDMVDRVMHNPGWQALAPKTFDPVNPIIPVRNPVERFRSACAQEGRTADEAITKLTAGEASQHFRAQSDYLAPGQTCTLYRFPEHIEELAALLGLDEIPEVNTSATNNGPKPDLTPEQLTAVQDFYAEDIALYDSINEPGTAYTPPTPEPEPEPVPSEVLTYKVFGQLAKEVMQGDDEQMQADLTQAGTMTNLLMEMTKAAPEEQIPAAMKPVALNEIERTQTIQRKHPFIDLYGPAFGYVTEEQKDAFFIRAQEYKFGV